jgi:hypothetical protein
VTSHEPYEVNIWHLMALSFTFMCIRWIFVTNFHSNVTCKFFVTKCLYEDVPIPIPGYVTRHKVQIYQILLEIWLTC